LDEPTNDLDIVTLNILEDFLLDFPGCLLVVSHDRYFMDKIVDHLFVFKGEGQVQDFPGNYTDYRDYEASTPPEAKAISAANTSTGTTQHQNKADKLSYNEQKEYKNLESKIRSLEFDKKELEAKFLDARLTQDQITSLSKQLQTVIDTLNEKELRWFELADKLGL
jgi:ATP-binding cassette subfamily F protein uup